MARPAEFDRMCILQEVYPGATEGRMQHGENAPPADDQTKLHTRVPVSMPPNLLHSIESNGSGHQESALSQIRNHPEDSGKVSKTSPARAFFPFENSNNAQRSEMFSLYKVLI